MADELSDVDDLGADDAPLQDEGAEIASPRTIDDYARERGWKPKEEWDGKGEWKDAKTFIDYGLDRARELGDHVKQLNRKIDGVHRSTEEMARREAEKARADERKRWEEMLSVAVDDGDRNAAMAATQKIAELSAPAPRQSGDDPLVSQFVSENAWFTSDPAAKAVAIAEAERVATAGGSVADQLKAAQATVLKRFPEYAPAAATPSKVVDVAAPTNRVAQRNGRPSAADLSPDQLRVAKYLVQQGRIKSIDAYVAQAFNKEGTIE
jgi:hypothetical protein